MHKLGTGGNTMAPKVGAAVKCVVEGLGAAAPVPPPLVQPHEVMPVWLPPGHMLPGWFSYATAPFKALGIGLQPMLGPVSRDAG